MVRSILLLPCFIAIAVSSAPPIPESASVNGVFDAYLLRERANAFSLISRDGPIESLTPNHPPDRVVIWTMTSQIVGGTPWTHDLVLVAPQGDVNAAIPQSLALLWLVGEVPSTDLIKPLQEAATTLGIPCAAVTNTMGRAAAEKGMLEEDRLAASMRGFLDSGDPDQPLLLAMVRTVTASMDILESWSTEQSTQWNAATLSRFVVVGAQHRGWAAWLSAAMDSRVGAIGSLAFDYAAIPIQIARQREEFGGPSASLASFASRGVFDALDTPRGRQLVALIDPAAYISRVRVPIWFVIGSNDECFPLSALEQFAWDLKNPFRVSYRMNKTSDVGSALPLDELRLLRDWADDPSLILPGASLTVSNASVGLIPELDNESIYRVRLWSASGATGDLRSAVWKSEPMARDAGRWISARPELPEGHKVQALMGELELRDSLGRRSSVSTLPIIMDSADTPKVPKPRLFLPPPQRSPSHDH
ncbi:MAG: PhoPQ-activated protein PqaA family protein [Planctomycetota bacterium]|nr:PhoPQ-activated protein PqaA family protein [Planctomycetota bacterium]